jgi:hypothetical protein
MECTSMPTEGYVHELWDDVLLRSTLFLRASIEAVPDETWYNSDYRLATLQMLDFLEGELIRRGLNVIYLQTLNSSSLSLPGTARRDG